MSKRIARCKTDPECTVMWTQTMPASKWGETFSLWCSHRKSRPRRSEAAAIREWQRINAPPEETTP